MSISLSQNVIIVINFKTKIWTNNPQMLIGYLQAFNGITLILIEVNTNG
jgi:hypothetical protein